MTTSYVRALALAFPDRIVDNATLKADYPDRVAAAEEHSFGKTWRQHGEELAFDRAMKAYVADPFRGAVRRRWREHERAVDLEARAAREALAALALTIDDIDLIICSSFFADIWGLGNAALLAAELGHRGPAYNVESACASALVSLGLADDLVRVGRTKRVLVVTSCSYSTNNLPDDPIRWGNGDGAAAFIVDAEGPGAELLGQAVRNTCETVGSITMALVKGADGDPFVEMQLGERAGRVLRDTAEPYVVETVQRALDNAGLSRDDVDRFVFPTPTAWYAAFCAGLYGLSVDDVVNCHPETANTGPVLTPTNLYFAAARGRLNAGDTVVAYAVGSVSNAAAAVLRWGDVKLGTEPPGFSSLR